MDFKDLPYHHSKIPPNVPERTNFLNELEKEFEQDLLTNEKYKGFFARFRQDTIKPFCKKYAEHKRYLLEHYPLHIEKLEKPKELQYREQAEQTFNLILQKKLFNMQLLWRAEKISIPEIKISDDFSYWEKCIQDCFFLEEVTPEEVSALKQFLPNSNHPNEPRLWMCGSLRYDDIMHRDAEGDFDDMPEWYEFYDGRFGTGALLMLPNTREVKEDFYRDIYDKNKPPLVRTTPYEPYIEPPPYLFSSHENYTAFINLFENEYIKRPHNGWLTCFKPLPDKYYDRDGVNMAIWALQKAEYPVYMQGGLIWHEAIIKCAQQYMNTIIVNELDSIYEEYLMKRQLKIGKHIEDVEAEYAKNHPAHVFILKQIIEGRALNNEPRDLNF